MDVFGTLQEIFRKVFDDEGLAITREMTAEDIEEWNSLAQVNIIVACERRFGIKFDLKKVAQIESVGDMIDLIEEALKS